MAEGQRLVRTGASVRRPTTARIKRTLGEALTARRHYAEADTILRGVLAIEREALPKRHIDLGRTLFALGRLHLAMRDPRGAEPLLRECYNLRRSIQSDGHWLTAAAGSELGAALAVLGRVDEAHLGLNCTTA